MNYENPIDKKVQETADIIAKSKTVFKLLRAMSVLIILAGLVYCCYFVQLPDNDEPGKLYVRWALTAFLSLDGTILFIFSNRRLKKLQQQEDDIGTKF
ncbi:MAG TPA: hypothetical protein VI112_12425 [Bacteroidia bacterium]|jgi:hypothetical protein